MRGVLHTVNMLVGGAVAILAACTAADAWALPETCGLDPMPAPVKRNYRKEPEEKQLALDALLHHFRVRPAPASESVCVTFPGHQPPGRDARRAFLAAGVTIDRRTDCRFEEGRHIWGATGVWRTSPDTFVVHVARSEFGHLSLFLEGYEYTFRRTERRWRVTSENPSACNTESGPGATGPGAR